MKYKISPDREGAFSYAMEINYAEFYYINQGGQIDLWKLNTFAKCSIEK